jgi:5-methyltetrahydropteroyltriglutamate--homocysteine methyltransferase
MSPQCGFASTVGGNPVSIDDQKRKLDLLVRTAARIWARLLGMKLTVAESLKVGL